MSLSELTDAAAVRSALVEFNHIGREAFLQKYDYGRARNYLIEHDGNLYDSKAIVGAALWAGEYSSACFFVYSPAKGGRHAHNTND